MLPGLCRNSLGIPDDEVEDVRVFYSWVLSCLSPWKGLFVMYMCSLVSKIALKNAHFSETLIDDKHKRTQCKLSSQEEIQKANVAAL